LYKGEEKKSFSLDIHSIVWCRNSGLRRWGSLGLVSWTVEVLNM
jgi:hypothetical protein